MRSIESPIRYFPLLLSLCLFTSTALNAEASLFLTHSSPSPLPGGLLSTTFSVTSTSGEIINSFVNPSLTTFLGPGLHQVWPPFINSATPTRENQLSLEPLWSDTWLPYDSY